MTRHPVAALFAAALLATTGLTQAAVLVVPTEYSTIQAAEDAAQPDDTILVHPGEYRETVTVDVPGLTIRGMTCALRNTIIDGGRNGTVLQIDSDDVTVACLTVRHGYDAIHADSGDGLRVENVTVIKPQGYGIYIEQGDSFRISNTNVLSSADAGVFVGAGADGSITNTSVRGADGDCFYVWGADNLVFADNVARGCGGYGFELAGAAMTVNRNTLQSNSSGMYIEGDGSVIDGNQVDSSCYNDDGLDLYGSDNIVRNNTINNCYREGIFSTGDRNAFDSNTITAITDNYCLDTDGADTAVTNNLCSGTLLGIYVSGDNSEIRGNVIETALYEGLYVYGDFARVIDNTVRGSFDGFFIDGSEALVQGNTASATTWFTFAIWGPNPQVHDNTGSSGSYDVFDIYCYDDCSGAEVSGNFAANAVGEFDGGNGFFIVTDSPGMNVSNNRSENNQGSGMSLFTDSATISSNDVHHNGARGVLSGGIVVFGDDNVLDGNRSSDNLGVGIEILGDTNTATSNTAERNLAEGLRVSEGVFGNVLTDNISRDNSAEGIDNAGGDTELSSNTATGNRTDCTNDGTVAVMADNVCADQSDFGTGGEIDRNF